MYIEVYTLRNITHFKKSILTESFKITALHSQCSVSQAHDCQEILPFYS